jgi:hypothetical protein
VSFFALVPDNRGAQFDIDQRVVPRFWPKMRWATEGRVMNDAKRPAVVHVSFASRFGRVARLWIADAVACRTGVFLRLPFKTMLCP